MKRIALFSITYDPFIGGAEVAIKEMTNRLPEYTFDMYTAKLDASLPDEEKIGNVYVYRVGIGNTWFDKITFAWGASKLALYNHKKNPYIAFHAIMANYAGLAALFCKKKVQDVPYIVTLQSGDSDWFIRLRTWFWYPWYRQIYTHAQHITAISHWLEKRARGYGYTGEVSLIPNGVDIERFQKKITPEERSTIRKEWGVSENDFVVITTSRLVYKNGIDTLIAAMHYTPESTKLVIVGSGKDASMLQRKAEKCGKRVIFIGQVDNEKLPSLLHAADVFARPSRSEGMGISFIEAMAAEVPVVATPVGGIIDFISHGETGMLAEVDNPESVGAHITTLKEDTVLKDTIVQKAAQQVTEKYAWNLIVQKYHSLYEDIHTHV